jgi:hypothetical protein
MRIRDPQTQLRNFYTKNTLKVIVVNISKSKTQNPNFKTNPKSKLKHEGMKVDDLLPYSTKTRKTGKVFLNNFYNKKEPQKTLRTPNFFSEFSAFSG